MTHEHNGLGLGIGREVDDDRAAWSIRWLECDVEDGDLCVMSCLESTQPSNAAAGSCRRKASEL